MSIEAEGFNVQKTNFKTFIDELEGKLALLTGAGGVTAVDAPNANYSFTLEDVRRPMLCLGLPGIGKTCAIGGVIEKLNKTLPPDKQLGFKKTLLGQTVVGTMEGIPVVNPTTGKVVRVQVPDLPDPAVDGEYGVYFLDEITTADEAQVQPALGLTDDSRSIGQYKLPDHWVVIAAGNGDDCANFVELHDMTISRFEVFDIAYDYKIDWRPWAVQNNIDEMIISFLNFSPTTCVRIESDDLAKSGKLFPTPRTWTRLSSELNMRKVLGKEVSETMLPAFASRIVGTKAANEFAAFCAFKKDVAYDAEKIAHGTEVPPKSVKDQIFHITLGQCMKYLKTTIKATDISQVTPTDIDLIGNTLNWFLKFETIHLDNCITAIMTITQNKIWGTVVFKPEYVAKYPEYNNFIQKHADSIMAIIDDLNIGA